MIPDPTPAPATAEETEQRTSRRRFASVEIPEAIHAMATLTGQDAGAIIEAIIEAVLDASGISRYEFFREGRCRDIVGRARQLAYWLVCRFRPDMGWKAKGRVFRRHHSTVMSGYWRFDQIRCERPVSRWIQHPLLIDLVEAASKESATPPPSSFARSLKDRARPFKGRRKGEAHPEAKMTTQQVIAIRADPRSSKEVAAAFGMSRSGIKDIRSRKTWRHI
jgi:hypothetical protein